MEGGEGEYGGARLDLAAKSNTFPTDPAYR